MTSSSVRIASRPRITIVTIIAVPSFHASEGQTLLQKAQVVRSGCLSLLVCARNWNAELSTERRTRSNGTENNSSGVARVRVRVYV